MTVKHCWCGTEALSEGLLLLSFHKVVLEQQIKEPVHYTDTHTHTHTRTHMLTAWVHHALSLQFTGEINPKRLSLLTPVSPSPQPSIHPSISSLHLHQQMCPFIIFCQVPSCLSLSFSLLSVYVSPICGPQHWSTTCMLYLRFPFSLCILTQVLLA